MRTRYPIVNLAVGLASLYIAFGLGFALWWLVYVRESLVAPLLLVVGLAVALFGLAAARHRAGMGWTVLFLAAFFSLFISVVSFLGVSPYLGPVALLLLAFCLWVTLRPAEG